MATPFGSMFGNLKKPCKMCGSQMEDPTKTFCSDKCAQIHEEIRLKKLREQQQA